MTNADFNSNMANNSNFQTYDEISKYAGINPLMQDQHEFLNV